MDLQYLVLSVQEYIDKPVFCSEDVNTFLICAALITGHKRLNRRTTNSLFVQRFYIPVTQFRSSIILLVALHFTNSDGKN